MKKIGRTIKRRRKEGKTDYKARMGFLKSGKARLVIRKTNKHVIVQLVESDVAKDKVIKSVSSKKLISLGWPKENVGSLKSIGACYLTGLVFAKEVGNKEAIADFGLHRSAHSGRLYAVLKGAIEGGMKIKCNEKFLPNESRINANEKIKKAIEKVKGELK
ncbi:50S ribosomal protein L18 [Candidatus Pacearchaeota archaeon CG10_big_fil_rev_8_21_14_0_10_35_219]|nr:50S ribosomal protein L18 [Candidatus Pacearchaeota archaeon]OIO42304.1 MAG: hypothetical protein AUJ63_03440 [Candidatus Pacearchaeota archaeon CG1_02_35_32]PIO07463.1 MAG: 50S ribosomal protein L18 [Candidatus Pacearchaeota archaeon CG10_big_fil_rev_8_21_14_0_10_35_219]PIY81269.1 MAG: 50S ribosomal protein L18 [Candidatus Pacearchaeota archaeon CG_4_10_14_0_8_um_filter_35_169]PIZ80198.1 MAG: 50S ribosomal protein L18 [Candidatus Pacearchaeota archaeon CG_4_10_14_0_2_um_filter_35_33]PJA695